MEELQFFWLYKAPYWAGQFLDKWCMYPQPTVKDRADEEGRPNAAQPSGAIAELVPRQRAAIQWGRRGLQHECKTDDEKSLRVSDVPYA